LSRLPDYLSEDHDLALLRRTAIEQSHTLSDPDDVEKLILVIDQLLSQLQAKSAAVGARIYAEKPKAFTNRMQAYWEVWRPTVANESVDAQQMDLAFEATSASSN